MGKIAEAHANGTLPPGLQRQADLILLGELAWKYPDTIIQLAQSIRMERQAANR